MVAAPADTVVLGAGIAGCALAFHLAWRSVGPIVVVDPRPEAGGATGRAAGVLTRQLWDPFDIEVVEETAAEYAALCGREAPDAYRTNGFVRFARRPEAVAALRKAHERLAGIGVRTELLDPAEAAARLPAVAFEEGMVALDSPEDGCVDPTAITGLYARGARAEGVRWETGRPPRRIRYEAERWRLSIGPSEISTRRLVLAAGAWTRALAASLGHPLPLCPYRTRAAVLLPPEPAPRDQPTAHDLDTDVYVRPEENGRILAGDGTELREADPELGPGEGDAAFLEALAAAFARRWPAWAEAAVVSAWSGVCAATPDRRPLIGPVPDAPGLHVLAGFNGFGIMRAGGFARRLADLLAGGERDEASKELPPTVRPGRFPDPARPFAPRPGFTLEGGPEPRF